MVKLTLGIPCMDFVPYDFFSCFTKMMNAPKHQVILSMVKGTNLFKARNQIADSVTDDDYLMFLDSDMVFEPDLIDRLIASDKDIVSGMAFIREYPFDPAFSRLNADGLYEAYRDFEVGKLIEVDGVGMACTLIKRKVLDAMEKPYFEFIKNEKTGDIMGEDVSFCRKAKEKGFKVYVDTNLEVGHIAHQVIGRQTFEYYKPKPKKSNILIPKGSLNSVFKTR